MWRAHKLHLLSKFYHVYPLQNIHIYHDLIIETMKVTQTIAIATTAIIIAACGSSKKNTASVPPATPPPVPSVSLVLKPANGIYAPGTEELTAIQKQYPDVTIEKLKEGHFLYAEGACVKCHGAKNIYMFNEMSWKNIMDDMAIRARISDEQKDAVYKYVLAIKATEGK